MSDYRILSVPTSTTAIVSTIGLYRVVTEGGEILGELLEDYEAEALAETYNELHRTSRAVVVRYSIQQPFRPRLAAVQSRN